MNTAPDPGLRELAEAAGVARHWRDVDGRDQIVGDDVLSGILQALGHETGTSRKIRTSLERLAERQRGLPPMVVTEVGLATPLQTEQTNAVLTGEDGRSADIAIVGGQLAPISTPGYYRLAIGSQSVSLAAAPSHCPLLTGDRQRIWGTSIQIPALRGPAGGDFGGFAELAGTAETLARRGCDAVAINPVHALFPGVGDDYSPYSPSSRTFLNTAMGDPALLGLPALTSATDVAEFIDWPSALPARLAELRRSFAMLGADQRAAIAQASAAEGPALQRHALFDALYCHFRARGRADWRAWPAQYKRPNSAAVQRFAAQNSDEIAFHLYAQWLAREGLDAAQTRAINAGMSTGLIADLAVGVHPGGSDCWSMPEAMLHNLTIGAPPDPLGPLGQNWSITGFSPDGLREAGYAPWIAMLRSALRSAGGLRIDHAFGLARLWVIPAGGDSAQGGYLSYPFLDLLRLVTLEAHRSAALIIAEDLGTSPHGFTQAVSERQMLGMRVLWYERAADHGFIGARDYPANCAAMTGTHDTPTVAGWWRGRDLDWADQLGRLPAGTDRQKAEEVRDWDRGLLWSTIGEGERPDRDNPDPVLIAALDHVAKSPALLAIAPIEDLLGQAEQPNLPGTTSEHPNWRRRLAAPLEELLNEPQAAARVAAISNRS